MVWTRTLLECVICGRNFPAKKGAKTCGPKCRQAAYRVREAVRLHCEGKLPFSTLLHRPYAKKVFRK